MSITLNSDECYIMNNILYWDITINSDGVYEFYANVSSQSNKIPKKSVQLCIQYPKEIRSKNVRNKETNNRLNNPQTIKLGKLKLKKSLTAHIELTITNRNIKVESIRIISSMNGITKKDVSHSTGDAKITNIVHTHNLYGFYHEFGIVRKIQNTNYLFGFDGGLMRANYDNNTMEFTIYDHEHIKSQIATRNNNTKVKENTDSITVTLDHKIRLTYMYKMFIKIDQEKYNGRDVTNYHAFFGSVCNKRWYYIATIRRYGNHSLDNVTAVLNNTGTNGHLESSDMTYGRSWYFINDVKGVVCYPVSKFVFAREDPTNSRIFLCEFQRIFMQIGAGMSTSLPTNTIGIKRKDKIPVIPIDFVPKLNV